MSQLTLNLSGPLGPDFFLLRDLTSPKTRAIVSATLSTQRTGASCPSILPHIRPCQSLLVLFRNRCQARSGSDTMLPGRFGCPDL